MRLTPRNKYKSRLKVIKRIRSVTQDLKMVRLKVKHLHQLVNQNAKATSAETKTKAVQTLQVPNA